MTDPLHKPRFLDTKVPITYLIGITISACTFMAGWALKVDNRGARNEERITALEARTTGAAEQAYELRNIASQLAEVNKKLADLNQIQSQMTVMEFRMGNAEYALGLNTNRKPVK
ncbi:MAG: hypothetical protein GAK30_01587 [Paracidovorax wautersii]|uniref:Uncharacterized protein n=1 Tax=Paracidovorax wautersii TaxID=1177982 RepID=A0A7V8FPR7_9BURK|nr:MAG: hypothetical protein GAK30_01587 [Paracidovorax wautersii]